MRCGINAPPSMLSLGQLAEKRRRVRGDVLLQHKKVVILILKDMVQLKNVLMLKVLLELVSEAQMEFMRNLCVRS
jgi:hypothetical protein